MRELKISEPIYDLSSIFDGNNVDVIVLRIMEIGWAKKSQHGKRFKSWGLNIFRPCVRSRPAHPWNN